jgi:glycosyltransferase involved in cell wall biosynthesis
MGLNVIKNVSLIKSVAYEDSAQKIEYGGVLHLMNEKKDLNLLIICHGYRTFTKGLIEATANNFNQVYVLVRHNSLFDLMRIARMKKYQNKMVDYKVDLTNKPHNVQIIVTNFFYIPFGPFYKHIGDKHFKATLKQIRNFNVKFDLIHAHFIWSSGYVAAKLKNGYDVPAIVTAHGFDIYNLPFRDDDWKTKVKCVLGGVDYISTVSQKNAGIISDLNVHVPVKVIPNGYDPTLFRDMDLESCRNKLHLPNDKKILLSIGHLNEVKGYKYLILAMDKLVKEGNDILSIIVGEGHLKKQLEEQIKRLNLENNVKFVGLKPHDEIPYWINACDIFVLSSLSEGNPTVMFEALGCGKPFIGTNVGGVSEIITDDRLGFVVEPKDSDVLSDAIIKAVNTKWDKNYILNYSEQFTWECIAKRTLAIYDEVLGRE